jgi:hypothetical protein
LPLLPLLIGALLACGGAKDSPPDASIDGAGRSDVRGVDEPFGRACAEIGKECPVKDPQGFPLICIALEGGSQGKGFCTRTCTDVGGECFGAPNGQMAGCFISGQSDKYCGFLCQEKLVTWTCPGTLTCGTSDKDGTAFCLP